MTPSKHKINVSYCCFVVTLNRNVLLIADLMSISWVANSFVSVFFNFLSWIISLLGSGLSGFFSPYGHFLRRFLFVCSVCLYFPYLGASHVSWIVKLSSMQSFAFSWNSIVRITEFYWSWANFYTSKFEISIPHSVSMNSQTMSNPGWDRNFYFFHFSAGMNSSMVSP